MGTPHRSFAAARHVPHLRAALADPDPTSRRRLRQLLEEHGIAVVGGCESGSAILGLIEHNLPDLLFCEVTLPDMDGFQLARRINGQLRGGIIFVTGHDGYALQAFQVHALDYLLKPVDQERLAEGVAHVRALLERRHESGGHEHLLALLDERDAERQRRTRLLVRGPAAAFFLKTDAIDWLEAAGKRVRIHASKRVFEQRDSLARIEGHLDDEQFVRVSRSAVVNVDRIRQIQPWFNGEHLIILDDGSQVPSSRRYRSSLRRLLRRG
jgi:two-component system, LytTR family, response regulator